MIPSHRSQFPYLLRGKFAPPHDLLVQRSADSLSKALMGTFVSDGVIVGRRGWAQRDLDLVDRQTCCL